MISLMRLIKRHASCFRCCTATKFATYCRLDAVRDDAKVLLYLVIGGTGVLDLSRVTLIGSKKLKNYLLGMA